MYTSPLYVPSRLERADPEKLSGLLLVIGHGRWTGTRFFGFASDPKRLEEVVKTFPDPLRDLGMLMIYNSTQRPSHQGKPIIYIAGYANTHKLYLNPEIKDADRYNLGIIIDRDIQTAMGIFERLSGEILISYFLHYDPGLAQQKPL